MCPRGAGEDAESRLQRAEVCKELGSEQLLYERSDAVAFEAVEDEVKRNLERDGCIVAGCNLLTVEKYTDHTQTNFAKQIDP